MDNRSTAFDYAGLDDAGLVELARGDDRDAFRHIMLRCNQRLFRMARGVLNDDAEAEDVVQEAYVNAFARLDGFRAEASLMTWLTRIVLNEAYGRLRQARPTVELTELDAAPRASAQVIRFPSEFGMEDPAAAASRDQVRRLVERAVENLPEPFRIVFVMREIEDCTVEETAQGLGLKPDTVKTRLHRARRLLRAELSEALASTLTDAFPFLGVRCQRMTQHVLERIAIQTTHD
jgi:RNA polymerase sigma factor (sigma-70 family)